jgi:ABC-type phosphate/phosphonate transport system substrate-binding protein
LSNEAEEFSVWKDPALVLSQTCGMPYRLWLHDKVTLIGTPDYGLEGCPPGYYRSPIVVRRDDERADLPAFAQARFAYNVSHSQSGFASIYNTVRPMGFWFQERVKSGAHQASARMVAAGEADIAALDAVTWDLIQRYDDFAGRLRVLCWTAPTPGLPYIAAAGADQAGTFAAVKAAIERLDTGDRAALGLKGFVAIPKAQYLAVPNPPAIASVGD